MLQPHRGRHHVARQPDEREQVPLERRHDQREARPRAVDQRHHRGRHAREVVVGEADHQVVRQHGQRVDQRLGVVAPGLEARAARRSRGELAAQHAGRCSGGVASAALVQIPAWTDSAATLPSSTHRHDEQVERHAAVDAREAVGLDDQRRARPALLSNHAKARS